MTTQSVTLMLVLALAAVPRTAEPAEGRQVAVTAPSGQAALEAAEDDEVDAPAPPSAAPEKAPPPPPSTTPAPPVQQRAPVTGPSVPGQWVYTQQYGWIWMPYAEPYTYVPADGYGEPYAYVYYPAYGWTWVVAPWVWGWGPWPYFGAYGAFRFAWFGHGWWRTPWRWHFAHVPGVHGGFAFHGIRPTPFVRGPVFHGAPAARGFAGHGVRIGGRR